MKNKLLILLTVFVLSACGVNYKLSKACSVSVVAIANGGGKITACVSCDSIGPRLLKKLVKKYGIDESRVNQ